MSGTMLTNKHQTVQPIKSNLENVPSIREDMDQSARNPGLSHSNFFTAHQNQQKKNIISIYLN